MSSSPKSKKGGMQNDPTDLLVFLLRQRNRADAVRLYQEETHVDFASRSRAIGATRTAQQMAECGAS